MKSPALRLSAAFSLALSFAASAALAAPADDLTAAARKLADALNYAWTTTTEMANAQFPAMPAEGVTEKGGFTVITRSFNDIKTQTVRKGTEIVSQNRDGDWLSAEEMRAQFGQRGGGGGGNGGGQRGGGGGGGGGGRGGFGGGMFGGNASNPAEQVANYAGKLKDLKVEDGAIVGVAKGEEATALLAPAGGRGGQGGGGGGGRGGNFGPKYTSVTMKFWVKDGAVTKYSVHSLGTISFNGEERDLDSTTTTEIKSVGSAKVEVPEAAKKKFAN